MKRSFVLVTLLGLVLAVPASAQNPPSPDSAVYRVSAMLSGTFEGITPGNHLTLNFSPVTLEPARPYDLFLSVTGTFENDNIVQQGVLRLETQGRDVYWTYIPHFNPIVTALSADAGRFTERELSSACSFVINPKGDGFTGETLGNATCAMAMRGAIGKWTVDLEPGSVRVRNNDSGETLRFRKSGPKQ